MEDTAHNLNPIKHATSLGCLASPGVLRSKARGKGAEKEECESNNTRRAPYRLLQIHEILHILMRDAHIDHPVHEVEAGKHDGKHDPAVLVYVAGPHPEQVVGRLGGGGRGWVSDPRPAAPRPLALQ